MRSSSHSALRWCLVLLAGGVAAAALATPVHAADNTLVSETPAANSVAETSPALITLVFAAPVGPSPQVTLTCGDPGAPQSIGPTTVLPDQVTVRVPVPTPVPKGQCTVTWRVTDPSQKPAGSASYQFSVLAGGTSAGAASSLPGLGTPSSSTTVISTPSSGGSGVAGSTGTSSASKGPLGLFRLVTMLGLAMLFGALVVIAIAWPEGVEYILTVRHLRAVWAVALGGSFLYAAALEGVQSGNGLGSSIIPTSWGDLVDTTSGKAALLGIVLVAASFYAIARPERIIDPATQLMALVPAGLALATLGFGRDNFGAVNYLLGTVHAVAMGVWLGGLLLLNRVVLAGPGDEDLVHAVRGFARLSQPAWIVTVVTGLLLAFQLDRNGISSGHGLLVVVKALLVFLMVFVGWAAQQFINTRVAHADMMTAPIANRLRRALGIEVVVGIVVLVITSWLVSLTPAGLVAGGGPKLDIRAPHRFANPGLNIDVSVAFGEKVGLNDVRIEVTSPQTGLSGLTVEFDPQPGSTASGMMIEPIPLTGRGVAVLKKSTGFSLGASGTWTMTVRIGATVVGKQDVFISDVAPTKTVVTRTTA
jgi:copper transport protein